MDSGHATSKQETSTALSDLRASVKSLEDKLELSTRFSKIEEEHDSWKTLGKYLSITLSILAALFTYIGYKSIDSFIRAQLDKRFAYSSDLSLGLAYSDKHPRFAIPFLLRCFDQRPFEEPVLISLLSDADTAVDWDTLRTVIDQLRKHPTKAESFTDPMTYNNIGLAELNLGFEDASHFTRAREAFERGIQITPADRPDVLWDLHFNKWRYYLAVDDPKSAEQEINIGKNFEPPPDYDSWKKAETWAWFKALFNTAHKIDKHEIERMYQEITRTEDKNVS